MKTSFKITQRLLKQLSKISTLTLLLVASTSCSKENMACQDNNSGAIIVENSRTKGIVKVFFNQVPKSGNVPGDLNITPGQKASIVQPAGQFEIFALLDTSSCSESGNSCIVRNETLGTKTVNLSACQDLNLVY